MQQNYLIFYLMISCCFFLCYSLNSFSSSSICLSNQSSILLQLKHEFTIRKPLNDFYDDNTSYPKMETWKAGSDCCFWDGVTCNMATGHVVGLDLSNSWLQGPLRSNSSLFSLVRLQKLYMAFNNFNPCSIPPEFGQLSRLTHLNLSYSVFSGPIPIEMSHLSQLISLDLSTNNYNGSFLRILDLKSFIRNMTDLREFHMDRVDLSSTQLKSLPTLSSLTSLSLRSCNLQGKFPENLLQLREIQTIDVSFNEFLSGSFPEFHSGSKLKLLNVSWGNFTGKLPNSIGNLRFLDILDLSGSTFSGTIPASFWNLSELTHLDLSFNNFCGQLPFALGNLRKLNVLDFSSNQFSGEVPFSLGNLSQLERLYLGNNTFTGQILFSLGNLIQLIILDVEVNNLNGTIPPYLFTMPSLETLWLRQNQFTGSLDFHNISSSQLRHLSLSGNKLDGQIPQSISKFESLNFLDLHSNNLSGTAQFGNFSELWFLDLSDNRLLSEVKGGINSTISNLILVYLSSCNFTEFPAFLEVQDGVEELDLSNNKIEGNIPEWLGRTGIETLFLLNLSRNFLSSWEEAPSILPWKVMKYLDLQSNRLQGSFPVPPLSTEYLFISSNNLTGRIHPSFCKLSYLQVLDVSSNNFTGTIPPCLGNFSSSLSVMNMRENQFHGSIPDSFINGSKLRTLDLSHNNLQGNIPRSLVNCEGLQVLNLGYNQISDTFPFWLEYLQELQVLVLRSNKFSGPIWDAREHLGFEKLRIIDISFNNFEGTLPSEYFRNWTSMVDVSVEDKSQLRYMGNESQYYQDSVTVTIKGSERELVKILTIFTSIDLSNNRFEGEVPVSLGDLRSLIVLNISSNNLTGFIPSSFGNLVNLESLDISKNELSGTIPQQLRSLTFLAYLNLSYNHLTGPIPQGGQLSTFVSSSFEGNSGLCGFPLSKTCEKIIPTVPDNQKSESKFSITWRQILLGYGCGAILGVVIENVLSLRTNLLFKIFSVNRG
ncbi:hypothetical protein UlMin_006560 [Ulmus minor]